MNKVRISIFRDSLETYSASVPLPIELGRQREEDSGLHQLQDLGTRYRIAITPSEILSMPREAIGLEQLEDGGVLLRNIHRNLSFPIDLLDTALPPSDGITIDRPCRVTLPSGFELLVTPPEPTRSKVSAESSTSSGFHDASMRTMAVSAIDLELEQSSANLNVFLNDDANAARGKMVVALVNQALEVVQKSAGSDEFLDAAARSTARMISLDNAYVILLKDEAEGLNNATIDDQDEQGGYASDPRLHWNIVSSYSRAHDTSWRQEDGDDTRALPPGSTQILARLLLEQETVIFEPSSFTQSLGSSLMLLDRAVASPLVDANQNIIGALYGDRKIVSNAEDAPIGDLEAALLKVMASAVAAGILRQREETARRREEDLRSSMNQFFSPEVLQRLQQNENLLDGRDAEVTVLFCDIRGFSAISERVGPKKTIQWINDVFTTLSQCVLDTDGVLVDYIGDELMAMWGAPDEQADHACRACRAAHAMVAQMEPIRKRWEQITPDHFGIGIGINTGMAQVGNTGSLLKFKYGPLGTTVNLASRIQGMTKQFGVTSLVSEPTRTAVLKQKPADCPIDLQFRKIAEVQPVGVQSHIEIHQLASLPNTAWCELRDRYEQALMAYQTGNLTASAAALIKLIATHSEDKPSVKLLQRVVDAIAANEDQIDPVIRLTNK